MNPSDRRRVVTDWHAADRGYAQDTLDLIHSPWQHTTLMAMRKTMTLHDGCVIGCKRRAARVEGSERAGPASAS